MSDGVLLTFLEKGDILNKVYPSHIPYLPEWKYQLVPEYVNDRP